jgi:hypothetical protein
MRLGPVIMSMQLTAQVSTTVFCVSRANLYSLSPQAGQDWMHCRVWVRTGLQFHPPPYLVWKALAMQL